MTEIELVAMMAALAIVISIATYSRVRDLESSIRSMKKSLSDVLEEGPGESANHAESPAADPPPFTLTEGTNKSLRRDPNKPIPPRPASPPPKQSAKGPRVVYTPEVGDPFLAEIIGGKIVRVEEEVEAPFFGQAEHADQVKKKAREILAEAGRPRLTRRPIPRDREASPPSTLDSGLPDEF